jgi:hypothetical protein
VRGRTASVVACIVATTSGCDVLFRLDEVRDAGSSTDASTSDAPIDAVMLSCPQSGGELELPLVADTTLFTIPAGGVEVLIGRGGFHILATFDLGGLPITEITNLRLELHAADTAHGCSTTMPNQCSSCQQSTGNYLVYLSNPDWDEATATSTHRTSTELWEQQDATGAGDRTGGMLAEHTTDRPFIHTRAFSAATLPAHWDRTRISFHLEASGAIAYFHSKEAKSCGTPTPPKAVVTCVPGR